MPVRRQPLAAAAASAGEEKKLEEKSRAALEHRVAYSPRFDSPRAAPSHPCDPAGGPPFPPPLSVVKPRIRSGGTTVLDK